MRRPTGDVRPDLRQDLKSDFFGSFVGGVSSQLVGQGRTEREYLVSVDLVPNRQDGASPIDLQGNEPCNSCLGQGFAMNAGLRTTCQTANWQVHGRSTPKSSRPVSARIHDTKPFPEGRQSLGERTNEAILVF